MRLTLITLISIPLAIAQAPPPAAPPRPPRVQPPARITEFRAQPVTIQPGQSATLIWATENPNGVEIDPEPGRVTPRGSHPVSPKATTTYTLTVRGPNNTVLTKEVTVTVPGTTPVNTSAAPATEAKREVPRLANGKPDLSGVYSFGGGGAAEARAEVQGPRCGCSSGSRVETRHGKISASYADPTMPARFPTACPSPDRPPSPFRINSRSSRRPAYAVILHEYPGVFRIVPTNGAAHPVDPDPTWMGDSIGKWEGDTLVVDTVGFNTRTELSGFKHSEALHIVERFSRPDFDTLQYDATLEDPNVFVRPWTVSRTFPLRPDLNKIDEFVCENNKDYSKLFVK